MWSASIARIYVGILQCSIEFVSKWSLDHFPEPFAAFIFSADAFLLLSLFAREEWWWCDNNLTRSRFNIQLKCAQFDVFLFLRNWLHRLCNQNYSVRRSHHSMPRLLPPFRISSRVPLTLQKSNKKEQQRQYFLHLKTINLIRHSLVSINPANTKRKSN